MAWGLQMPAIFSDHLVLQSGEARIWGWDDPGAAITATFRGQTAKTTCQPDGSWSLVLPTGEPGPGGDLVVKGSDEKICHDSLVGNVWLASGQSNMAMGLRRSVGGDEAARTVALPEVRFFEVPFHLADKTDPMGTGAWVKVTPKNAAGLSAVAFYFARVYQQETGVPLGVIECARGGSSAQAWMSPDAYASDPTLEPLRKAWDKHIQKINTVGIPRFAEKLKAWEAEVQAAKAAGKKPPPKPTSPQHSVEVHRASVCWHGMLEPLLRYTVKGVLWYQGESNVLFGPMYEATLTALMKNWRDKSNQSLPFLIVQLPGFGGGNPGGDAYAKVREGQAAAASKDKQAALMVTMGWGEETNIHPHQKRPVGEGLAKLALDLQNDGRLPEHCPSVDTVEVQGAKALVRFGPVEGPLQSAKKEEPIVGFEIAGPDHLFHPATAEVVAPDTIALSAEGVSLPVAVRYGWANFPKPSPNLVDAAGWRVSPFRWQNEQP